MEDGEFFDWLSDYSFLMEVSSEWNFHFAFNDGMFVKVVVMMAGRGDL
jgi:hypothetical protein